MLNNPNNNGQDASTIESNHSSPVWSIPSTSSSVAMQVSTGNGSHPLTNPDLFNPEPYSVAAMAVSRYADDLYMNCYSTKMNSLLLAQAATNKLNDPINAYNRKLDCLRSFKSEEIVRKSGICCYFTFLLIMKLNINIKE